MHQPVNTTFRAIPQWVYIGISRSVVKALRSWIMLDDKVVPIQEPQRTIRTYFGLHRSKPVVRTSDHVPAIALFLESRSRRLQDMFMDQASGRFSNEGY